MSAASIMVASGLIVPAQAQTVSTKRHCLGCGTRDHLAACAECGEYFCTRDTAASMRSPAELSCYRQHELSEAEEAEAVAAEEEERED
jgi:hypothetical protein